VPSFYKQGTIKEREAKTSVGAALTNTPIERLHWHQEKHKLSLFKVRSQEKLRKSKHWASNIGSVDKPERENDGASVLSLWSLI
jgi:hypothetical protein